MKRGWQHFSKGFSLVEVLLSIALFGLLITALGGSFLYAQESSILAGNRSRAQMLAEEGVEAVRNIRDSKFANLSNGTYGLSISNNKWALSGSSDTTGIFTRQITISTIDSKRKNVTVGVVWQQNLQRQGSVYLVTELTNWKPFVPANCNAYCIALNTPNYGAGVCRASSGQCAANGEIYQSGGNGFCANPNSACCCQI